MAEVDIDLFQREDSAFFRMAFDFFTPRAYFIMLEKKGQHLPRTGYQDLKDEEKDDLLSAAKKFIADNDLTDVTLSVHMGSWYRTESFHVHLVMSNEQYIRVFRANKKQLSDWPTMRSVNKQWKKREPTKRAYECNVYAYPLRSYQDEDIKDIKDFRAGERSVQVPKVPHFTQFKGYKLIFHRYFPLIGFQKIASEKKGGETENTDRANLDGGSPERGSTDEASPEHQNTEPLSQDAQDRRRTDQQQLLDAMTEFMVRFIANPPQHGDDLRGGHCCLALDTGTTPFSF